MLRVCAPSPTHSTPDLELPPVSLWGPSTSGVSHQFGQDPPDTYPASLLLLTQFHSEKTRNRVSAPRRLGQCTRPCPRTQISSPVEVGGGGQAASKI